MAKKIDIVGGINIIAKHAPDDYLFFLRADHDQIWAGEVSWTSEDEARQLEAMGWFRAEGSWSRFV